MSIKPVQFIPVKGDNHPLVMVDLKFFLRAPKGWGDASLGGVLSDALDF